MPKYRLMVYKYGGGNYGHPIYYGVKTKPNNSVPYLEKKSLEGVIDYISSLPADVLKRKPDYGRLSTEEISKLEQAIAERILALKQSKKR